MWPDRVSNPGPLTYESGALPTALCGPANIRGGTGDKSKIIFLFSSENIYCDPTLDSSQHDSDGSTEGVTTYVFMEKI